MSKRYLQFYFFDGKLVVIGEEKDVEDFLRVLREEGIEIIDQIVSPCG